MSSNDPVLQPLSVGSLTLKNRIYSTGHAPQGYLDGGRPGLRYELYHEEKAKGGLALTIIGGSSNVAPDSASVFEQIYAGSDDVLPFYRSISDRVHRHGTAIMIQLTHLGRRSKWNVDKWLPAVSPSGVRERAHRSIPKVIEGFEIERIIEAYGAAARRARDGGLDGVEIAAIGGHLIDQFWSPRTNRRTDEWGGSLENRTRFSRLVLEEVRRQVGSDFVVGVRMPGDEGVAGGLSQGDCIDIATSLNSTGLIDFFSVIYGGGNTDRELAEHIAVFGRPLGGALSTAGAIRKEVDVPIFHAGRIADLATARHALNGGYVDMVGMTRAHIADPHIVRKLLAGAEDRIRPCVGATYCAAHSETVCLHNPATGREATIPHVLPPAATPRRVVVVGGGPAGLEAARACAERGHDVTLLEAADRLGGQVLLAARGSRQAEKIGIVNWLEAEVRRLGVRVQLNTFAEPRDVLALDPDVVVIATGGMPSSGDVDGAGLACSTWDVLSRAPRPGRTVLIYDDHGGEQAVTAAEWLAKGGCSVEIVTPDRMVAQDVTGTVYPDYFRTLYANGVEFTPDQVLSGIARRNDHLVVTLANAFTDAPTEKVVDDVVVELGAEPVDELYFALRDGSSNGGAVDPQALLDGQPQTAVRNPDSHYQVFRIGDATAHRNIHAAILDARRLALAL